MQGILIYLLGAGVSLTLVTAGVIVSERAGKKYATLMIVSMLAGVTLFSDIMASAKLSELVFFKWHLTIPVGTFAFPVILLGQDYLNEFYGDKVARTGVWGGFLAKLFMAIMMPLLLSDLIPSGQFVDLESAARFCLAQSPRMAIASIICYWASGYTNVYTYAWIYKTLGGGPKWLWVRNNVSSNVAMLFDSVLFIILAFGGTMPWNVLWSMIWAMVLLKWICNWADTLFLYLMYWLKSSGIISGEHHRKDGTPASGEAV